MSEIRPLTEREKVCLSCSLDICDDRSKECRYVQIARFTTPLGFHTPEAKIKAAAARKLSLTLTPEQRKARKLQTRRADDRAFYQANRDRINARRRERRKQNALG